MATTSRRFWDAVDERLGISALSYEVPEHAQGIAYSLGGVSLVGFVVLVGSGIWLAQFYDPMPQHVRASLLDLLSSVPGGLFLRNLHYWAANVVMVTVLLHLLRVLFTGSFKRPREANWLVGVALLAITVGLVFTGTILKWDQEAVEALGHNVEVAELLGGLGGWFSPQFAERVPLLSRIFIAHVSILPVLLGVLLVLHLLLVKLHGLASNALASRAATTGKTAGQPSHATFLEHLGAVGGYALVGFGVLVFLSVALPAQLGPAPVEGIEVTKPWWPFLPLFALENWLGLGGLLYGGLAVFAFLALIPLLDRSPWLHPARRKGLLLLVGLLTLLLVALALYAKFAPGAVHLS
jgi:quinol-cytochrome oxidoreductase complex cytochrome b subunit